MKSKIFFPLLISIIFLGCGDPLKEGIDGSNVNFDSATLKYTYKDNGKPITGEVTLMDTVINPEDNKVMIFKKVRNLKNGFRYGVGYTYSVDGKKLVEEHYKLEGEYDSIVKFYGNPYPSNTVLSTGSYKDSIIEVKMYTPSGVQEKEVIYDKDYNIIKEYDFEDGKKIIPTIEKLECLKIKTGYYLSQSLYNSLFVPMVQMKWKNVHDEPLEKSIKIKAVFIDNNKGEEFGEGSDYLQGFSDAPLQPNLIRQSVVESGVGWTSIIGVRNANISCQLYIEDELWKTLKIRNVELTSNRMQ